MASRNVIGGGVAGGRTARDENKDAAIREVGLQLAAGSSGCGIVSGEHRSRTGFLQVGAEGIVVEGGFLDEPRDFSSGEELFELVKELEIESPGDDQAACRRKALLIKDLNGCGRHLVNRCADRPQASVRGDLREFPTVSHGIFPKKTLDFQPATRINASLSAP